MNRFLTTLGIFLIASGTAFTSGPPPDINKYVKCTIELKSRSLKAGASGEVLISLKPVKGIHINLTPPVSIVIDSSSAIRSLGSPAIPKKGSFLDVAKEIRQPFTLSAPLSPGSVNIKGTLVYYYCSDAEGWCSKFKQPVDLTVTVVK